MPHRRYRRALISPRGWGLLIMGAVGLARAWSYLEPGLDQAPTQLAFVDDLIPLSTYAFVWIVVGLGCLHSIVWKPALPYAVGLFVGMHALWALSFLASWVWLDSSRAWVSAISYVALAGMGAVIARMIDPPDIITPGEVDG